MSISFLYVSDNDVSQWRGLQMTRVDVEEDEGSRTSRLLSNILDELRQLTGKMERDEARQDEINDRSLVCFEDDRRTRPESLKERPMTRTKDERG